MASAQSAGPLPKLHNEGPAIKATINGPRGLALYQSRVLYIAEGFKGAIRRVDLDSGTIATVRVKSKLDLISSIAVDSSGDLIISEYTVSRVRKIHTADGTVSLLAKEIEIISEGESIRDAGLVRPDFVTTDNSGNIYIADLGRILRLDAGTGKMTPVVTAWRQRSKGEAVIAGGSGEFSSVAVDHEGNLLVSQRGAQAESHRIFRLDAATGIVQTIAGSADAGLTGDGGFALSARLQSPSNLLLDRNANLFVVDPVNDRVRRLVLLGHKKNILM